MTPDLDSGGVGEGGLANECVCERCGNPFDARCADGEAWNKFDILMCPACADQDAPAFLSR